MMRWNRFVTFAVITVMAVTLAAGAASAQTKGSFSDPRDNKTYRTVKIGSLTWMAENLNYSLGNYRGKNWCYDYDDYNCKKYGWLYDWESAMQACPDGWRLPTKVDWDDLVNAAGGVEEAGGKLKSEGWGGTDEFGFSALPGGLRSPDGEFDNGIGKYSGSWWSATECTEAVNIAHSRNINWDRSSVYENKIDKEHRLSVRCVE